MPNIHRYYRNVSTLNQAQPVRAYFYLLVLRDFCGHASLKLCALLLLIGASGCASQSKVQQIQAEKEKLKALVASKDKLNEQLASQLQTASQRVAEAERELALAAGGKPIGRPSLVNAQVRSGESSVTLDAWSRSETILKFNPTRRAAKVGVQIGFGTDDRLTFEGRRETDKVADLLATRTGARCGVRIYGIDSSADDAHAKARAEAVGQYLHDVRGVANDRIEFSHKASSTLVDEEGRAIAAGVTHAVDVELFELSQAGANVASEPTGSVDGWTNAAGRRR